MNDIRLHIERNLSYSGKNTYIIEGLSPDEMNSILDAKTWDEKRSKLIYLLNKYGNDYQPGNNLGTVWGCGYGIYGIRHFGGHLIVDVGSSCD